MPLEPIQVVVVNLPHSEARRDYMRAQCAQVGVQPVFFPAVDGRVAHPLFAHIDQARRLRCKGKPFTDGERGCWASHYLIWQHCVQTNQALVVLEDDAELCPGFRDFIGAARDIAQQIPYARLYLGDTATRCLGQVQGYQVHHHRRTPFGTVGYLLTPAAARRFLAHAEAWVLAVDDYMDLSWRHGVPRLALAPPVVSLRQAFGSMVQSDAPKPRITPAAKLMRELFRSYLLLRNVCETKPRKLSDIHY